MTTWTPVHDTSTTVRDIVLKEFGEHPLGPFVVVGVNSRGSFIPRKSITHALQLGAHVFYVAFCPFARIHIALDGGIFRWQTKGIKAHWVDHLLALHPTVADIDVGYSKGVPVADVEVARRVRELY